MEFKISNVIKGAIPGLVLAGAIFYSAGNKPTQESIPERQQAQKPVTNLESRVTDRDIQHSLSQDAIDFIKGFEKLETSKYNDQGGKPTICYGHLIKPNEKFSNMTEKDCEVLLRQDINKFERVVRECITADISENQYDALVSLAFNIGSTAFRNSTLVKILNSRDYDGAAKQFDVWRLVNGKVSNGLVTRRAKERAIFEKSIYDTSH